MCQPKRRALQKNEKRVQLGTYAFNQFYKLSAGAKKDKTYEEFCLVAYAFYPSCKFYEWLEFHSSWRFAWGFF